MKRSLHEDRAKKRSPWEKKTQEKKQEWKRENQKVDLIKKRLRRIFNKVT